MRLEFQDLADPLDPVTLKASEKSLRLKFPKSYRKFLAEVSNGARTLFHGADIPGIGLAEIRGIGREESWLRLEFLLDSHSDRISPGFFPFGTTIGGDVVCVSTRIRDKGSIWLWNHDMEPEDEDDPPLIEALTRVADSFEDFIDGNYDLPG